MLNNLQGRLRVNPEILDIANHCYDHNITVVHTPRSPASSTITR